MTTKKVSFYVCGWTCSGCKKDNYDGSAYECAHCGKDFDDTKDTGWEEDREFSFPAKWEICGTCRGSGTTYLGWSSSEQPAFTREDMDYEGPDFFEDYMTGRYDKQCPECKGDGKVLHVDEKAVTTGKDEQTKVVWKEYQNKLQGDAEYAAECAAERRMGC